MYITHDCVCFYSKIVWTFKTIIKLQDIIQVEKKAVAGFIQNAIEISTEDSTFFFGSFFARDAAHDMLTKILASLPNEAPPEVLREKQCKESPDVLDVAKIIHHKRSVSHEEQIVSNSIPPLFENNPVSANESRQCAFESHITHPKASGPHISKNNTHLPQKNPNMPNLASTTAAESHITHPKASGPDITNPGSPNQKSASLLPLSEYNTGKIMVGQSIVNTTLKAVWEHLFSYDSAKNGFSKQFWGKEKYRGRLHIDADVQVSDWSDSSPTESIKHVLFADLAVGMSRSLNMIVPILNPLAPKESRCNIKEKIIKLQPE
jgi:hypothetical protein